MVARIARTVGRVSAMQSETTEHAIEAAGVAKYSPVLLRFSSAPWARSE